MNDQAALFLLSLLLLAAATGYRYRAELQPNALGAAMYSAGIVAWGVALFALWLAWSAGASACSESTDPACTALEVIVTTEQDEPLTHTIPTLHAATA